ncbi:MAG: hypothetical protein F4045_05855 [Chloroflexi bacterium]|nr:hypothetical protein [Chloroflexota bacterium]MYK34630.1 hypothetical protein [Chloroflexota bacterium]
MVASDIEVTIDIRPAASVYATYRRLSYKPWYAIAEFVDNSTQNYYDHRADLIAAYRLEGNLGNLRVEVAYDSEQNILTILDNAHGMDTEELTRAVVLDRPPPDPTGRCEYGMGLKTAACWFGTTWTIRTSKLGSSAEYTARVHVPELVDSVAVGVAPTEPETHYTSITIEGLYKPIRGRTPGRVKDQLGSMYREDLRSGEIEILWNGEPISFEEPSFLEENLHNGVKNVWRKGFAIAVPWESEGTTLRAEGWVGVRTPGSQRDAGFALLRRGRVIVGGPGEGYKPAEIFGQGNTFRAQRLVGEIRMDAWPVTQAKDAFDWSGGLEDDFIEQLKRACQDYMDKAEGYRERGKPITQPVMEVVSEPLRRVFSDQRFGNAVHDELRLPDPPKTVEAERADTDKIRAASNGPVLYRLDVGTEIWLFRLHWQDQLSDAHWMQLNVPRDNEIDIFLNTAHPFLAPYLGNRDSLALLQKFVLSLALAERMALQISSNGLVSPSDFRMYMNKVLRRAGEIEVDHGQS